MATEGSTRHEIDVAHETRQSNDWWRYLGQGLARRNNLPAGGMRVSRAGHNERVGRQEERRFWSMAAMSLVLIPVGLFGVMAFEHAQGEGSAECAGHLCEDMRARNVAIFMDDNGRSGYDFFKVSINPGIEMEHIGRWTNDTPVTKLTNGLGIKERWSEDYDDIKVGNRSDSAVCFEVTDSGKHFFVGEQSMHDKLLDGECPTQMPSANN